MVFESFEGKSLISFHQPNNSPDERAVFLEFKELLKDIF